MGSQAKERGLVDEFGGLDKAIEVAKGLANIPAEKGIQRVIMPYPRTFFEELFNRGDEMSVRTQQQRAATFAALPEDARRALRYTAMMDHMKRGEMMALMPFELRIK
jgi:protease-4